MSEIKPGQIYRHYKGNLYGVIGVATHTETEEQMVIYFQIYGDGKVWVRPLSMWEEIVNGMPRFKLEVEDVPESHA